ncbi:hypothetical protein [Actinokineospora inagensis]|uniref:hypothetical protein n=1 Tax=Actinokineospora inagensis TaxID=103730 RepID=UPI0012FB52B2|nr:hypothetical protein [Actinokineospora inagensis]
MTDPLPDLEGRHVSVRPSRLLPALFLGVLLALGAGIATAPGALAQPVAATGVSAGVGAVALQPTAPSVDITPAPTQNDKDKAKNKLVVGVVAVVLLAIVIYGNRVRAKRRKKG